MTGRSLGLLFTLALLFLLAPLACDSNSSDKDAQGDVQGDQVTCEPSCAGRECGPDGCGGYCGSCEEGFSCNAQGTCEELPQCELAHAISCGGWVSSTTDELENHVQGYTCNGYQGAGAEIGYVLVTDTDDHVRIKLDSPFADLDILVTQAPCEPGTCLAFGDDEAELDTTAGTKYYIMVEGQVGLAGPFELSVECDSVCQPDCAGKECGDDGCGGFCGECPVAAPFCKEGKCAVQCTSDCTLKECGDDGCGGSCGSCPLDYRCAGGNCVPDDSHVDGCEALATPGCDDCACQACVCNLLPECCATQWNAKCATLCAGGDCMACELPGGFGEPCQTKDDCAFELCVEDEIGDLVCSVPCVESCPGSWSCVLNKAVSASHYCSAQCYPDCSDRECGDDGCGGSCGECGSGQVCLGGVCAEAPSGACLNDPDMTALMEGGLDIYNTLPMCAFQCQEGEDPTACATPCVMEQTGLSEPCAECFADLGLCTVATCMEACMMGFDNADCAQCLSEAGCMTPFEDCTGLAD